MFGLFRIQHISRALSLLTALAASWLAFAPQAAHAGAYTYDTSARRTVHAGILLLNSTTDTVNAPTAGPDNKDPYLFHVLNQRIDIRPFGWNIINPLAPRTVTQVIQARWNARANVNGVYGVGQTITPNMAPYWEVDLQRTSAQDIGQFDILFLGIDTGRVAKFSVADVQKLLHFVDNGGTLFIEYVGNGVSSPLPIDNSAPLFTKFQFHGTTPGGSFATLGPGGNLPLVTTPYLLSGAELNALGDKGIGNYYMDDDDGSGNTTPGPPGPGLLSTVIGNSGQGKPVISAGSLGAGSIVISVAGVANAINETVDVPNNIPGPVGPNSNSGPYTGTNFLNAPTPELKFLSNLIASVGTHPNEHQNSHNTGSTPNGIPSASRTWTTNGVITGGTTSPVINGNLAYVTTGATLRAFDLYPAEDLDGDNSPDDGANYAGGSANVDYIKGAPYDQVWQAPVGDLASAPTVAVNPVSGKAVVFVEQADGTVVAFDGDNGGAFNNSPLPGSGRPVSYTNFPAPAPAFYNGRIYAGGADGSLYVYDLRNGRYTGSATNPTIPNVDPNGGGRPIVAPPTVGTVLDGGVNDIVALVTTNNAMYSIFLGARGETLQKAGTNYNTKLVPLTNSKMNVTANPDGSLPYRTYNILNPSIGYPSAAAAVGSAAGRNFSGYTGTPALLADYDADVVNVTGSGPLTRTLVGGSSSSGNTANLPNTTVVSAPALDHFGNVYYTVGSALFCVHDSPTLPQIKWLFRLPTSGESVVDADGTDYGPLQGFRFVGAPVVDDQGLVYVLATNDTTSVVLCFDGQGGVSADAPGAGTNIKIRQPFPFPSGTSDFFGNVEPHNLSEGQFTINEVGHIEFNNFGENGPTTPGARSLYPNLNEPFPILVQITPQAGQPQPTPFPVALHTNLAWYSGTANYAPSANSGLTKVGASLFYTAANGHLIRVDSDPTFVDVPPENKPFPKVVADVTTPTAKPNPMFHDIDDTGVGAGATPSSANGVLAVSGPKGVSLYTNQVTLVADSNRIVEMDSDGKAMWAVDATLRTSIAGGTTPYYNGATPPANPGQYVTTSLELNRPSSVAELTANDYLVADTGNNRCVRFDRGAKVIWELTKFNSFDTNLLRPGEPDTLNQPTSVQIRSFYDKSKNQTLVQYLISDSGNFRVLEVSDIYDANFQIAKDNNGNLLYHVLTWVSRTHDLQGRDYRYQGANYYSVAYPDAGGTISTHYFVASLVTNKRIATLPGNNATTGALAPANQDVAGGSIVLLNYPGPGSGTVPSGFIASATTSFQVGGRTIPLRNPRFLKSYAPNPPSTTNYGNFLLADDNGAYDLALTGLNFSVTWGFTQADYGLMTIPLDDAGAAVQDAAQAAIQAGLQPPPPGKDGKFYRQYDPMVPGSQNIPFVPTSIQKLGTGRYLITNGFSQGEAGTKFGDYSNAVPPGFGGEVFEVDTSVMPRVYGGYGGHTLSRPTNTGALSQPTFAHRIQ